MILEVIGTSGGGSVVVGLLQDWYIWFI
jgi:hypothetical protein